MLTGAYDTETLGLLTGVFEEAWTDIQTMLSTAPLDADALRSDLAARIMVAGDRGERDPKRLKLFAMRAIDG